MAERTLDGRRILVVEDEYFIAADLRQALVGAGAEVLGPLPTVAAATDLIESGGGVDLAILDINLQGEPIFPVADMLQAKHVPFLFATGFDQWSIPDRFSGVPRLEKPQKAGDILAAVKRTLSSGQG